MYYILLLYLRNEHVHIYIVQIIYLVEALSVNRCVYVHNLLCTSLCKYLLRDRNHRVTSFTNLHTHTCQDASLQ